MLTRIDLRHFKCFERLKLPLRPLTLLAGANAAGKSSVMQALTLLHQTMRVHEWSSRLMLNGDIMRLGMVADIIDQEHGRRDCEIALHDGDAAWFAWEFEGERNDMSMAVHRSYGETASCRKWDVDGSEALHRLLPEELKGESLSDRLCRLTYLTAERLGPREQYVFEDPQLAPVVGPRGEYTVSVLYAGRDFPVLDGLAMPNVPPTRHRQVEARMATFFPDCGLDIREVPRSNALTLGIRTSKSMEFHRPTHTGFGLTQVLPIIVATLSANDGDLLLIENPEVHLHPSGQAKMGEFLAEATSAGVQILVETHSDHVLNGIRRAVKGLALSPDDVALHFFRPRQEDGMDDHPQVQSLTLDVNAGIDAWPDGFFDQFDKDMNHFADWD